MTERHPKKGKLGVMSEGFKMIKRNMAKCGECDETIESLHWHHFVTCRCGHLSIDGGTHYLKRTGLGPFVELSEFHG